MKSKWQTSSLGLQKMLFDIESGKIDLVMVSEISRISRNMKDFSEIWELMKKNNCGFYSLRENFDTTTAAGEMVLYTIANIAQFERRLVSERLIHRVEVGTDSVVIHYNVDKRNMILKTKKPSPAGRLFYSII